MNNALRNLLLLWTGFGLFPGGSEALELSDEIAGLSLEELANLEISSVSRKPESLAVAAASIFVITADDIRRSGATTLPSALRLAPNLQVVRINATSWAISARGLNSPSANKLLVLIDGRPIYTPLHSGVLWDTHDLFMPDVERIEVISGPNAVAWGSNAVNGVINVVTKHAARTTGVTALLGAGDFEQDVGIQIGGGTDDGARYRVYGKRYAAEATEDADGVDFGDSMERAQAGFRLDTRAFAGEFTVQGGIHDGEIYADSDNALDLSGGNLLAHWQTGTDAGGTVSINGYYDRTTRRQLADALEETLDIFGINFTHQLAPIGDHALVWGADLKQAHDKIANTAAIAFLPPHRDLDWVSLFIQDEMHLADDLVLTLGARAEDNTYTGLEFMPNARLAWSPTATQTLWTSLSRAVRTPSRLDRDVFAPAEPPYLIAGGETFDSEIANVIELGWRAQPVNEISLSLTAFHHDYDRLRTLEPNAAGALVFRNGMRGTINGVEGWFNWQAWPAWRISGGFLTLNKRLELRPGSNGTAVEGNDPNYQLQLRSVHTFPGDTELDVTIRRVDELPELVVPAYTTIDMNLAWQVTPRINAGLRIYNLLDREYVAYDAGLTRSVFGRHTFLHLTWAYE